MELEANSRKSHEAETRDAGVKEVHYLDVLIILSKRWKLVLSLTVGVGVFAGVFALTAPNVYTAKTMILPPAEATAGAALLGEPGGGLAAAAGASLGIKNPEQKYVSLFRSQTLEDTVIQRFGLMSRYHSKRKSDSRAAFEAHSEVGIGAKDGFINISVTDSDPNFAAALANGYVDEYRKFSANLALTEASQRRVFFAKQLQEANNDLETAQEKRMSTQQSTGVIEIGSQTQALFQSAGALRDQIVTKEVQLQVMRSYSTDDNPQVVQAKQELAALKEQLAKLHGSGQDVGMIVPKGEVPEAELESMRQLHAVTYYQTISDLMAKQFEMAKLDEARQGSTIQVVDLALPPDRESGPHRAKSVIKAMLGAFVLSCIWCFAAEGWRYLKKDPKASRKLDELFASFR